MLALQTVSSLLGLSPSRLFIAYVTRDRLLVGLLPVQDCAEDKEEEEMKKQEKKQKQNPNRQKRNAHSSSSLKKVLHIVQRGEIKQ